MSTTSDRRDPRLGHGSDSSPVQQNDVYLVLSDDERARGFVRPVRRSYRHAGPRGPQHPLRDLTGVELQRYAVEGYVKYEEYPGGPGGALGRFWTQEALDGAGKGCQAVTTMTAALAETYAARPSFYGSTYCVGCSRHRPVGPQGEFTWLTPGGADTAELVGT